jgi:aminoglycoside phosphotransferase (APT) family kinase protein
MSREYRLMHSLGPAGIPVPITIGLCTDEAVNDRPFYVMEFVEGHILRSAPEAEAAFDEVTRRGVGDHMADTLAALHDVEPDAVELGDLGRHEGYIERQLKRWRGQYDQMQVEGVDPGLGDLVERVSSELAAHVPKQQRTSVVHGDYRMDNVVLADDGSVRAILDWEICTLGDPLADVGMLMVYWADPTDASAVLGLSPTTAPGFSTRAEVLARYDAASDLDLSGVGYYTAFAYWKLACILQGVYARYVAGAGAGDKGSVDAFPAQVRRLFEMAAQALESVE